MKILTFIFWIIVFIIAIVWILRRKVSSNIYCPFCNKQNIVTYNLKNEITSNSDYNRDIQCLNCQKRFKIKNMRRGGIGSDPEYRS